MHTASPSVRRLRLIQAVLLLLLVAGCTPSPQQPRAPVTLRLLDGAGVETLLAPAAADTTVVLVYDPSDCFVCDGELAQWIKGRTERGWTLRLVLKREPTPSEQTQLQLFRLDADDFLHPSARRLATPRVYRYSGAVLVDSAIGRPAQTALLTRISGDGDPYSDVPLALPASGNPSPP